MITPQPPAPQRPRALHYGEALLMDATSVLLIAKAEAAAVPFMKTRCRQ